MPTQEINRTRCHIAESDKEVENKKRILAKERGLEAYKQVIQRGLVGTHTEIQTMVSTYASLGVDQFLSTFQNPLDIKSIELFMKSVKWFDLSLIWVQSRETHLPINDCISTKEPK